MDKVQIELSDVLYIQDHLKTVTKNLVEEQLPKRDIDKKHKNDLVQQEMEEWISNIFEALSNNISIKNAEGFDRDVILDSTEPLNEHLKAQVAAKELELNQLIEKTIEARTDNPKIFSNLAKEICMGYSQQAEEFQIASLPSETIEEEEEPIEHLDTLKEEYVKSIKMLSNLSENIPIKNNTVERVNEISKLFKP